MNSKNILFKNITLKLESDVERLSNNAIIVKPKGISRIVLKSRKDVFTIIIRGN